MILHHPAFPGAPRGDQPTAPDAVPVRSSLLLKTPLLLLATLLCALLAFAGCKKVPGDNGDDGEAPWPEQPALPDISGNAAFYLQPDEDYINVMENYMPRMPRFPQARRKELILNGFVADLAGNPLAGAYIGLRSPGTVYIAASATTDENGYYQMNIPLGGADIYAAGYTIEYGNGGRAALSLYPADGNPRLDNPGQGVVKNFVLLSYGLADAARRAAEPWSAAGYFG
ncbi:MAG TPA: Ig-like domain-containing protein, partial [Chitinophagaceae bacterium]|nr:Ig-like domain-containing protein [Chitinophagaceae bacterium]